MAPIHPRDLLVLMPCSATKRPTDSWLPAHDLYDGPLWQTLRTHRGSIPWGNVCVLSGKFGFICAETRLRPYEAKLTTAKAAYLVARGVLEPNDAIGTIKAGRATTPSPLAEANGALRCGRRPYRAVICAGSGEYALVLQHYRLGFIAHDLVDASGPSLAVRGGIGEQRQQLGEYLAQFNQMAEA